MADYSEEVATADELIEEFGGDADLLQDGGKTGPDFNPTRLPPIVTPITIVDLRIMERDRAGTMTGAVTRTVYAKASANIAKGDRLRIGGVVHTIDEVHPLQPAPDAQVVFYKAKLVR